MSRIITVGACLALFAETSPAQPDHQTGSTLRLEDAVNTALGQSPAMAIARLEAEALGEVAPQAAALPDPVLRMGYAPRPMHMARGTLRSQWQLEQTIPFPGKRSLRRDVAALKAEAAEFETEVVQQDLVLSVRLAFARLFSIQQQLDVLEFFEAEVERFEEAAAAEYEVGRGPQQALLRAQLEKNALGRRELSLRADWHEAARDLARATNDPSLISDTLRVERPRELENVDARDPVDRAMTQRPEFDVIESASASADRAVGLARRDFFPDVTLQVTYTDIARDGPTMDPDGRDAVMVGAGIRIPLWRGSLHAKRQQREIEKRQLEEQRRALESDVRIRSAELQHRIELERENLTLLSEGLVPQAEITRDATLAAYKTGRVAFIDLLDAERMLFELQLEEISSLERLHSAVATMHRILGSPVDTQTP